MNILKKTGLLLLAMVLLWSCKKKQDITIEESLENITIQYVKNELGVSEIDSVKVLKVDTVTQYGYVQINIEILEQLEIEEYYEMKNATQNEDTVAEKQHELNMRQIGDVLEQWRALGQSLPSNDTAPYRYLVTANYYSSVGMDQFYFFVTPEMSYYVLDPYGDELVQ